MSLVMRKPVFGVFNRSAQLVSHEIAHKETRDIILYRRENKGAD